MQWSRYLVDERVMMFHPYIAKALGLNEAIFLQQLHYWLNRKPHMIEERGWVYNAYKSWQEQLCFMSESTVKRTIKNLIDKGIIITANFNKLKFDRTLWYSIDYDKLDQIVEMEMSNMTLPLGQIDTMEETSLTPPIPSNNTSITTNNNIYTHDEKKEKKHKYGEYQNVLLTDTELEKLKNEYSNYEELIKYLDESIEMKGYKYKSHYLAIKKWVVEAVKKNNIKTKDSEDDSWDNFERKMRERGEI